GRLRGVGGALADNPKAHGYGDETLGRTRGGCAAELKDDVGGMLLGEKVVAEERLAGGQGVSRRAKAREWFGDQRPAEVFGERRDGFDIVVDLAGDDRAAFGEQQVSEGFNIDCRG